VIKAPLSTVEEIDAKRLCIFGKVQLIFKGTYLHSQDAATIFFKEML